MKRILTFMMILSLVISSALPVQILAADIQATPRRNALSGKVQSPPKGTLTLAETGATTESSQEDVSSSDQEADSDNDSSENSEAVDSASDFSENSQAVDSASGSSENSEAADSASDSSGKTDADSDSTTAFKSAFSDETDDAGAGDSAAPGGDSSPENPIGDNSSYYNVGDLSGAPDISAESAVLMDASTGAILYGKEADTKRYPASITKVMTALLAIENCKMDDIVTFSSEAVNSIEVGSSSAGINIGAQLPVEDVLYALMLVSANEAGAALAEHIAGSDAAFADMMTARAAELGCTGTHFTNPHGLPDEDHYTTAHDMALILRQAMQYEEFRKVAETITYTLEKSDTLTDTLELWNHAKILRESSEYYYEYAKGAKTGFTQVALNTLVTYAQKDNTELLCVILKDYGADSSYNVTAALFRWGFEKVQGITPLETTTLSNLVNASSDIDSAKKESILNLKTSFNNDYYVLVPADFDTASLTKNFVLDEDAKTKRLGYITIQAGDTVIGQTPVTYEGSSEGVDVTQDVDGNEDDLETAPNSDTSLSPHKLLEYIVRVVIAIALITLIMWIIRKRVGGGGRHRRRGRRSKH